VAITPAAGFVTVPASIIIGLGAGGICFFGVQFVKERFGVDDALDVVGVHGVGGTWGALATGIFATVAVNTAGGNGLLYGNPQQLLTQAIAVIASWVYACVMTFIIMKAIDALIGLRVPEDEEVLGLDTTQHGEIAYQL
jgi:Amt family ammonium transporter